MYSEKVPRTASPQGNVSPGRCIPRAMYPQGNVSPGQCIPRAMSPQGNVSLGQCIPRAMYPQGNVSPGQCIPRAMSPQGNVSPGQCLPGQCSSQVSQGMLGQYAFFYPHSILPQMSSSTLCSLVENSKKLFEEEVPSEDEEVLSELSSL